jgi:hypothetical protein
MGGWSRRRFAFVVMVAPRPALKASSNNKLNYPVLRFDPYPPLLTSTKFRAGCVVDLLMGSTLNQSASSLAPRRERSLGPQHSY